MCSIEIAANDADANLPSTAPVAASGAIDYCGLLSKLKCTTALADGRKKRRDYLKKYAASPRGKEVIRLYERRNRVKRNAYNRMRKALKNGYLVRPATCSQCNGGGKIEGHHDDYAKPFEVRWLCRKCHKHWHNLNGKALNG